MNRKLLIVIQMFVFALIGGIIFVGAGPAGSTLTSASTGQSSAGESGIAADTGGSQNAQPATTQDFQDVPPSNPFFNNIRNIYYAGIVSGYPCGGTGEPCGPGNIPYYRPSGLVTRQAMAKFVDNARKQPGIFIDTTTDGQPLYSRTSAANGRGVQGDSISGNGVHGISSSNTASGVYGGNVAQGFGVAGRTNGTGSAIYGDNLSGSGYAGYFNGNVRVQGTLTKAAGGFEIDDPADPANKYLEHSFVESPDMMNLYNGNVTLDDKGEATVQMPDYFQALNEDFRYQLTAIGAPGPNLYIAEEITNSQFKIAGGQPGSKVSWQVTGIRHDPYADQNRLPVETTKPADEQGKYLHPELYGQPDSQRIVPAETSSDSK
jgi:hypothetical protein